jgi:hypothetical protein
MKKLLTLLVIFCSLVLISCEKEAGVGGTATIKGVLYLERYNVDYSQLIETIPAKDEKVYIQYGDTKSVSDDVDTSPEGYFEFTYLYEGDYTIYYYSEDSSDIYAPKKEVLFQVNLGKGEDKDLGDLTCFETLDFDDGKSTISGTIYVVDGLDSIVDPGYEVYLRPNNGQEAKRIRTLDDGTFYFVEILPGDYTVYVLSEEGNKSEVIETVSTQVTVTKDSVYYVEDLYHYRF